MTQLSVQIGTKLTERGFPVHSNSEWLSRIKAVVVHQLYQTVLMKPAESETWFLLLKDSVLIQNLLFMHTE